MCGVLCSVSLGSLGSCLVPLWPDAEDVVYVTFPKQRLGWFVGSVGPEQPLTMGLMPWGVLCN